MWNGSNGMHDWHANHLQLCSFDQCISFYEWFWHQNLNKSIKWFGLPEKFKKNREIEKKVGTIWTNMVIETKSTQKTGKPNKTASKKWFREKKERKNTHRTLGSSISMWGSPSYAFIWTCRNQSYVTNEDKSQILRLPLIFLFQFKNIQRNN